MPQLPKAFKLVIVFLTIIISAKAQDQIKIKSIYFNSNVYRLSQNNKVVLDSAADTINEYDSANIILRSYCDYTGSKALNKTLSAKRAWAAKNYLYKKGIANPVTVRTMGRTGSIKNTAAQKKDNRRVDVLVQWPAEDVNILLRQIQVPVQSFCIDPFRDTVIVCQKGTIIKIKANSFRLSNYKGPCIKFSVKEIISKQDMLAANLTTTSNGKMLESQGMLYTEALYEDKKIELTAPFTVILPVQELKPDVSLFNGELHHGGINWVADNEPVTGTNVNREDIENCKRIICGWKDSVIVMDSLKINTIQKDTLVDTLVRKAAAVNSCRTFFCKIKRFFSNLFSSKKHKDDLVTEKVKRTVTTYDTVQIRYTKKVELTDQQLLDIMFNFSNMSQVNIPDKCLWLQKVMTELKITDPALVEKSIAAAFKNGVLSENAFGYYITKVSNTGYANFDLFVKLPPSQLTSMTLKENFSINKNARLVFSDRNTILPFATQNNVYAVQGIPLGSKVWVMAIKYEQKKAFIYYEQKIITPDMEIVPDYKEVTLEKIKDIFESINGQNKPF